MRTDIENESLTLGSDMTYFNGEFALVFAKPHCAFADIAIFSH
jgi:hypothetical protein